MSAIAVDGIGQVQNVVHQQLSFGILLFQMTEYRFDLDMLREP
jgi:hypothetical protein